MYETFFFVIFNAGIWLCLAWMGLRHDPYDPTPQKVHTDASEHPHD